MVAQTQQLLIGEAESLSELQEFLRERGLPQDQIDLQAWCLDSELSRKFSVQVKPKHDLFTPIEEQERMLREEVLFQQLEVVDETHSSRTKACSRQSTLPNHQGTAGTSTSGVTQSFSTSVCTAGRRKIKRLHLLHQCWMVPGVDYFAYSYVGKSMPPQSDFDEVCKMCAVRKEHQPNNASDSESDPSTDDVP